MPHTWLEWSPGRDEFGGRRSRCGGLIERLTRWGVSPTPIEGVSDYRAPSEGGHGAPYIGLLLLDGLVDVEEGHAWFNCVVGVAVVDFQDLVHALEVEDD